VKWKKRTVVQHFQSHIGSCVKGRVIRFDGYNAYFDLGKAEAVLPKEDQIKQEEYAGEHELYGIHQGNRQ